MREFLPWHIPARIRPTLAILGLVGLLGLPGRGAGDLTAWDGASNNPHAPTAPEAARPAFVDDPDPETLGIVPLWGGGIPGGRFPMAEQFDNLPGDGPLSSQACMSCHDGVISASAPTLGSGLPGATVFGGGAMPNHPVGVDYAGAASRGRLLHAPSRTIPGTTTRVGDLLVGGRVECISCHAMTRETAIPGSRLLRQEYASARDACMVCHDM